MAKDGWLDLPGKGMKSELNIKKSLEFAPNNLPLISQSLLLLNYDYHHYLSVISRVLEFFAFEPVIFFCGMQNVTKFILLQTYFSEYKLFG